MARRSFLVSRCAPLVVRKCAALLIYDTRMDDGTGGVLASALGCEVALNPAGVSNKFDLRPDTPPLGCARAIIVLGNGSWERPLLSNKFDVARTNGLLTLMKE